MKILGTGLNGLIGSRIVELLNYKYEFQNLSRTSGVDILDYNSVFKILSESDAKIVIHLAAYTDVKKAEEEKQLSENSQAYKVNVIGTKNISQACRETEKKLIYFSTDLVLGEDRILTKGLDENTNPNPLSWYAKTKYEGEMQVRNIAPDWIIARTAYPYRSFFEKPDFVRFFVKKLREGNYLNVLTDRIISPTFIDDIAFAVDKLIDLKEQGFFHVSGSQKLSVYDAVLEIAENFKIDKSLVKSTTRMNFLVNRPQEPFFSALDNAKIKKRGIYMSTFSEGLKKLIEQGFK